MAVKRVQSTPEHPTVFGIDILPMDPVSGAELLEMDFTDDKASEALKEIMNGPADVVMSDMAANTTGIPSVPLPEPYLESEEELADEIYNELTEI